MYLATGLSSIGMMMRRIIRRTMMMIILKILGHIPYGMGNCLLHKAVECTGLSYKGVMAMKVHFMEECPKDFLMRMKSDLPS